MTDMFTQDMKNLLKLANEGFNEFYSTAKEKSSGYCSTSAASGYYSKSVSSGKYSKSASSGKYSTSASSGDYSTSTSSGDCSTSASSGDYSTSAASGYYSKSVSSGDRSTSAASGYYSMSASSGDYSKSAASGYCSKSVSSGKYSKSASSGKYSTSASSGDYSTSTSSGRYSTSTSSGKYSKSASSGKYSKSASSGDYSACSALGYRAAVKGDMGNLLMCSEYSSDYKPLGGMANIVDGKILKPDCWYIVENGQWVEVDFSDNIFTYVISKRGNIKTCRTENGNIVYIVTDGAGNYAHGKTIKEAKADLIFKTASRDVSEYKGMSMDEEKTPLEWAVVYRNITGACIEGIKIFMANKKLKKKYTLAEVIKETEGAYYSDKFKEFFND